MPAVASLRKSKMPFPLWRASVRDRLLKSRFGALRSQAAASYQTSTDTSPSNEAMIMRPHVKRDKHLEIRGDQTAGDYGLGLVETGIRGATNDSRTYEEGVVLRSVCVHQSTRPAQSAAQKS